jgi:hypothetical protein
VSLRPNEVANEPEWSIEAAEELIASLTGVLSARIVSRPGGEIDEVHVLTTEEVSPKQTVRNVESALLAHFELRVDHRKISVAQTSRPIPLTSPTEGRMSVVVEAARAPAERRILFRGHQMETEGNHRVRVQVTLEWDGEAYKGASTSADLPRNRLEATAEAALRAIESAAAGSRVDDGPAFPGISLSLDGVKLLDAFDDKHVLVSVNAMSGRDVLTLTGSCRTGRNLERAVILATLQATDRWVRGRIT